MPSWDIESLTELRELSREPRKGRNPFDGYARGYGLQFGNVVELCQADPDFRQALRLAAGRTTMISNAGVVGMNLVNLFLLIAFYVPRLGRGHIVEFGAYKGGSAIFLAYLAQRFLAGTQVYAFDTYEGMPSTDVGIDLHRAGDFRDANAEEVRHYAASIGLTNVHFIQGRFEETAAPALCEIGKVALVHIDCDIYAAVAYSYQVVKPYLVDGSYIVLDDPLRASCLGAFEAVEEYLIRQDGLHAEQVFPQLVFRYPPIGANV